MDDAPNYAHLNALTDERGIFEHAEGDRPRLEHGYCVDDVARALVIVVREPDQTPLLATLCETYLRFLEGALVPDGRSHNRMSVAGLWTDAPDVGDWWGRSVWALGVAATSAPEAFTRKRALRAFHQAAAARSPHLHAMAFAALGAVDVVEANLADSVARALVVGVANAIPAARDHSWPWPEARLRYANGAVAEALIGAGAVLDDARMLRRGLDLLDFLLEVETTDDRFSVSGSAGRGQDETGDDTGPQFDQQPIEVAALVDACARAFAATSDPRWLGGIRLGVAWFEGDNDSGTAMYDAATGAGYDGLERFGRNDNRGAESTLAALGVYQQNRRILQLAAATSAATTAR